MHYPCLIINKQKFQDNARKMKELLEQHDLKYHFVTKAFRGWKPLAELLVEAGIKNFADSRVANLKELRPLADSLLLTRLPKISEADDVVTYADISLNSSLATLKALSEAALKQKKVHQVILMIEMGDLREGMPHECIPYQMPEILKLEGIEVIGLGANFNCYGGVIPTPEMMQELITIRDDLEHDYEREFPLISGGNSGNLYMLLKDELPRGINHLRIGEGYLLARETSYGEPILDLDPDAFILRSEVIEVYKKNSLPRGEVGLNAAGEQQTFKDEGQIVRGICAMGGQDVIPKGLQPKLPGVEYLGHSQDHTIFKLSGAGASLQVGDTIDFRPNYVNVVQAFTSDYVEKRLV